MAWKSAKTKGKKRLDVFRETSDSPGMVGLFETFLRKFRTLAFTGMLVPLIFICCFCMGAALVPAIYFVVLVNELTSTWSIFFHYLALGSACAFGFVLYGMTLIFVVPLMNFVLCLRLKAWRGIWFSSQSVPWFIHNALTYIVRYTFLEFVTPSPLNVLFYKMMGMKIGQGVVINSTNISDPSLIELGDFVTIGGSAHLMAHYGQKGILVLAPVKIGAYSTIGLKASVMGGVTIGENCVIRPHEAVLPKTVVKKGDTI